jgi:hypothetical protein
VSNNDNSLSAGDIYVLENKTQLRFIVSNLKLKVLAFYIRDYLRGTFGFMVSLVIL